MYARVFFRCRLTQLDLVEEYQRRARDAEEKATKPQSLPIGGNGILETTHKISITNEKEKTPKIMDPKTTSIIVPTPKNPPPKWRLPKSSQVKIRTTKTFSCGLEAGLAFEKLFGGVQDRPLAVINGVITPINRVVTVVTPFIYNW